MQKHILSLIIILAVSSSARVINVPDEYTTIQAGIDASVNGDTVLVAPGEYTGNVQFNGQVIVLTSSNGPDTTTIIGHIIISGYADTASCTIQGFTQMGVDRNPTGGQPGIRVETGKPKIIGNIIYNNVWQGCGGGIFIVSGYAIILHNIIKDNWAVGWGGGIGFWTGHEVEIAYNIITQNETGLVFEQAGNGGGIMANGGVSIFYNLIYDNRAQCNSYPNQGCALGGGILIYSGPCRIYNNTIANNYVLRRSPNPPYYGGEGGGMYIQWNSTDTLVLENNIMAFNERGGLDLTVASPSPFNEGFNLIYGNTFYNIDAPETSVTDIFVDPLFVDTAQNDFRLQPNSPCIDAGDPDSPLDPDSTRADIGALFFDQSVSIDYNGLQSGPYDFELRQNYPNPFNAQTTISYNLPKESNVSIRIYDLTGRMVKNLLRDEEQPAGSYRLIWDGTDNSSQPVSTAIYLYELKVGEQKQVKSMIVIR